MGRQAELAGVAHDIAHHSGSELSFINPHLVTALRLLGVETTAIDLLSPSPYPPVAGAAKTDRIDARKGLELFQLSDHIPAARGVLQEVSATPLEKEKLKRLTRRRRLTWRRNVKS